MKYEEKYNQTIESIKRIYEQVDSFVKELMDKEFPELRESEDERIRKELISFILDRKNWFPKEETKASWIAWLEKQGEQKPTDKVEQKPYPETLDKAIELYYYSYGNGKGGFDNLSLDNFKDIIKTFVEDYGNNPAEWSEEDEQLCTWCMAGIQTRYNEGFFTKSEYNRTKLWLKSLKDRVQL